MTGIGTLLQPWDLQTALSAAEIENSGLNNRLLYLRNGTPFAGDFTNWLDGRNQDVITVRPYQNERAIINGDVVINGSYVELRNLEFCYLGWQSRVSQEAGSAPSDIPDKNLTVNAPNVKLINCIIHDLTSPGFWIPATNLELYGCLIYHIGWSGPDRGHGHGAYLQNQSGLKTVKDCIIFDNFGWGIHAYSSNGANLKNFAFTGNTCFKAGSLYNASYRNYLLGAESAVADTSQFVSNMSYGAGGLEFYGDGAINVTLTDNYMPDGKTGTYTALSETGNYWGPAIGNQQFLRANTYDADLANLTIYNEAQANTIQVDVSAVYDIGDTLAVHNVQDYFLDIQELVVAGDGTITVNMQAVNRTVATPIGWSAPATTFPDFGCFRLVRQ